MLVAYKIERPMIAIFVISPSESVRPPLRARLIGTTRLGLLAVTRLGIKTVGTSATMIVMAMPSKPANELGSAANLAATPRLTLQARIAHFSLAPRLGPAKGPDGLLSTVCLRPTSSTIVYGRRRLGITKPYGRLRLRQVTSSHDPDAWAPALRAVHA